MMRDGNKVPFPSKPDRSKNRNSSSNKSAFMSSDPSKNSEHKSKSPAKEQQEPDVRQMSRIELLKAGLAGTTMRDGAEEEEAPNEMKTDTRGSFNKKVKFVDSTEDLD